MKNYLISETQYRSSLKKLLDSYFEKSVFKDSYYTTDDDREWEGFVIPNGSEGGEDLCLVCRPVGDDIWFSNGFVFSDYFIFFNLSGLEFNHELSKYIESKYGMDFGNIY